MMPNPFQLDDASYQLVNDIQPSDCFPNAPLDDTIEFDQEVLNGLSSEEEFSNQLKEFSEMPDITKMQLPGSPSKNSFFSQPLTPITQSNPNTPNNMNIIQSRNQHLLYNSLEEDEIDRILNDDNQQRLR